MGLLYLLHHSYTNVQYVSHVWNNTAIADDNFLERIQFSAASFSRFMPHILSNYISALCFTFFIILFALYASRSL